ncbi:MAG: hypothetical protein B9S35_07220 [Opitutia bacterium Tous-C5TDCM]|nr:MAG: hypothetical protein B9S35_07220 [Opitutae bacterium Tous-C5TDCM]
MSGGAAGHAENLAGWDGKHKRFTARRESGCPEFEMPPALPHGSQIPADRPGSKSEPSLSTNSTAQTAGEESCRRGDADQAVAKEVVRGESHRGPMGAEFTDEEEDLFNQTGEAVLRRLRKTRNPGDLLALLRSEHKRFDRAYAAAPIAARDSVACRAGCDACCHVPVGVQAHEVLIAAEFIQKNFSPEELDSVIARTAAHRAAFANKDNRERSELRTPCPMLKAGSCTIYESRPEACRSHHSHSAAACGLNLDPTREEIDVFVPGVRGRMFAVMLGIDQAVAEAGFDGQAYDFGSALHEALTDSMGAIRWMRREPAFPESCWEEVPGSLDDDAGVIRAEGFFQ